MQYKSFRIAKALTKKKGIVAKIKFIKSTDRISIKEEL